MVTIIGAVQSIPPKVNAAFAAAGSSVQSQGWRHDGSGLASSKATPATSVGVVRSGIFLGMRPTSGADRPSFSPLTMFRRTANG